MKCPDCGASIIQDNEKAILYCPYCGANIPQQKDALDKILDYRRFSKEHKEQVRQQRVKEENADTKKTLIVIACVAVIFALVIIFAVGRPHYARVQELEKLVQEIEADIIAGNYDAAELKANRLRLDDDYSSDQTKKWNDEREYLLKLIQEKRSSH